MKHVLASIVITEQAMQFTSQKELEEFQKALGRQVMYSMTGDDEQSLQAHMIDNDHEITTCYYRHMDLAEIEARVSALVQTKRPFVMGAVPHTDGPYSFHS